jgi:uncharacterized membrane protein
MDVVEFLEVFFAAMTPVGELRLSIPLGIYTLNLPWYQVLLVSVVGNIIPVLFIIPGLHVGTRLLHRYPTFLTRILDWRTESLLQTYNARFAKYGPAFLVVLVAIPLPITGAWTGSLASWAFGIPAKKAIPLIALGVVFAGIIVTVLTEMGIKVGDVLT